MKLKEEYLDKLSRIIELQKIMYFRAKYSEEDDAFEFCQHLKQCANVLGYDGDIDETFKAMEQDVATAKNSWRRGLDSSSPTCYNDFVDNTTHNTNKYGEHTCLFLPSSATRFRF